MRAPVSRADFFCDKLISRRLIRHTEQGFGQAHERDTFLIRQSKLLQERVQSSGFLAALTTTFDQKARLVANTGFYVRV